MAGVQNGVHYAELVTSFTNDLAELDKSGVRGRTLERGPHRLSLPSRGHSSSQPLCLNGATGSRPDEVRMVARRRRWIRRTHATLVADFTPYPPSGNFNACIIFSLTELKLFLIGCPATCAADHVEKQCWIHPVSSPLGGSSECIGALVRRHLKQSWLLWRRQRGINPKPGTHRRSGRSRLQTSIYELGYRQRNPAPTSKIHADRVSRSQPDSNAGVAQRTE